MVEPSHELDRRTVLRSVALGTTLVAGAGTVAGTSTAGSTPRLRDHATAGGRTPVGDVVDLDVSSEDCPSETLFTCLDEVCGCKNGHEYHVKEFVSCEPDGDECVCAVVGHTCDCEGEPVDCSE